MRVWVTRAEPEAAETARRLREMGHQPLIAPVLEIRPLPAQIDLSGVAALAFTSRNGVRSFAAMPGAFDLPAFAVGDATAAAARDAGFRQVRSADGDGAALAGLIAGALDPAAGAVLVVRPRRPAFDLEGALTARGFAARPAIVYESAPVPARAELLDALAADPPLDIVLVHSAAAAEQVAGVLADAGAGGGMVACCISAAAAAPLRGLDLARIDVAPFPNEAALLKLVAEPAERP